MHRYNKRLINTFLAVRLVLPLEVVFAHESSTQLQNALNNYEINAGTTEQKSQTNQSHIINKLNVTFFNEGLILSGIYIPKSKLKLTMDDKDYSIIETNTHGEFEFLIEELHFENSRLSISNIDNEEVFMNFINKDELLDEIYIKDKVIEVQNEQLLSEKIEENIKLTEEQTKESIEEPTENPIEEPTENPIEEPTENPIEEPTENPIEEPTENPIEEPTENPIEEPTENPIEEPTENPIEEPTENPIEEPTENPIEELIEKSSKEPDIIDEPTENSIPLKQDVNQPSLHSGDSYERNTSFERSTEVEELLHGAEKNDDFAISAFSSGMSRSLIEPSRQEFIDHIAPRAIEVANQKGKQALWPSLMIAQAVHESNFGRSSLGRPPYNNLFGIKGSYEGQSVKMWTWEEVNGKNVRVQANFRSYPSYTESLNDYANLMRNGLSWNNNYYSGTWRSNTRSVWEVLDNAGLKGYATDSNYYTKVRNIINEYNLTKYDTGNYYIRTGTFLGEEFTRQQMSVLQNDFSSFKFRVEIDNNLKPYSFRRIETTTEFIGTAAAQKIVNKLKNEKGWSSRIELTGNSTYRYRVQSGYFNTLTEAEKALSDYIKQSGYSARVIVDNNNKFRILTGYFNGEKSANDGLKFMKDSGWSWSLLNTNEKIPHYIVRTGTFTTPGDVKEAENYFNRNGWGARQQHDAKKSYYYRIYIDGFNHREQATDFVKQLSLKYNWSSFSFPVPK